MVTRLLLRPSHLFSRQQRCLCPITNYSFISHKKYNQPTKHQLLQNVPNSLTRQTSFASTTAENKVSTKDKLKKAVAEYGTTVIVFHVTISLISLGSCYLLVSSGIDVHHYMEKLGLSASANKFTSNAGVFLTAYAIHKVFAPARISITLGATPFIVRYLRNKGILKKPL